MDDTVSLTHLCYETSFLSSVPIFPMRTLPFGFYLCFLSFKQLNPNIHPIRRQIPKQAQIKTLWLKSLTKRSMIEEVVLHIMNLPEDGLVVSKIHSIKIQIN